MVAASRLTPLCQQEKPQAAPPVVTPLELFGGSYVYEGGTWPRRMFEYRVLEQEDE
jgi:hypothetical protein